MRVLIGTGKTVKASLIKLIPQIYFYCESALFAGNNFTLNHTQVSRQNLNSFNRPLNLSIIYSFKIIYLLVSFIILGFEVQS